MRLYKPESFNLRVYGLWITDAYEVLLCEEKIGARTYIKFPGGGLEFGEGILDCLKREWREETGMTLERLSHYYTTDFFQPSAFNPRQQVLSFYYRVWPHPGQQPAINSKETTLRRFILQPLGESFNVDLPIDRVVAQMLTEDFKAGRL